MGFSRQEYWSGLPLLSVLLLSLPEKKRWRWKGKQEREAHLV